MAYVKKFRFVFLILVIMALKPSLASAQWINDSSSAKISDTPVHGSFAGNGIQLPVAKIRKSGSKLLGDVELDNYELTLSSEDDLFANYVVNIYFILAPGKQLIPNVFRQLPLEHLNLAGQPTAYRSGLSLLPEIQGIVMKHYTNRSPSESQEINDLASHQTSSLRLELLTQKDNKVEGKIYLCIPDTKKSYIIGKFVADLK